ncbi:hypothetical protein CWATWH0003_5175 [Crocosphaera watsonii WH 0003]|uniref:Uncharacterized protein n=2 Tax=Crocosphaera watsonii TaxID=263511 RepID=G5JCM1_CROWT|nr:hypothetical protein CWATWH0003_5175 [Crocosphaera watsonii WH 0003]
MKVGKIMKNQTKVLITALIIFQGLIEINSLTSRQKIALSQGNCQRPMDCFELALKELQDAKAEIKELEKQLEKRLEEAEAKTSQAQNTANRAVSKADTAQNTANRAVSKANKSGGLYYDERNGFYVFPTKNNGVIHLGGGGTCYYEGNSRRWCH